MLIIENTSLSNKGLCYVDYRKDKFVKQRVADKVLSAYYKEE